MKNIVKLAKIFDRFIELDSSFVLVDDIKAIRKLPDPEVHEEQGKGIEVVTPFGSFYDSTDFDTFKTRLADALEVMKETNAAAQAPVQRKVIPIDTSAGLVPNKPTPPMPMPVKESAYPVKTRRTEVEGFGKNGANGFLFSEDAPFRIVNRELLEVQGMDGSILAKGTSGGTIIGDTISGIVYENGKYTLADKGCGGKIVVVYQVQGK